MTREDLQAAESALAVAKSNIVEMEALRDELLADIKKQKTAVCSAVRKINKARKILALHEQCDAIRADLLRQKVEK